MKIKVIYIAGHGRSGSTLLDRTLGELPHFFSVGEIGHIGTRGFKKNQLCSCGEHFNSCNVWNKISKIYFRNLSNDMQKRYHPQHEKVSRTRHIPYLILKQLRPSQYKGLVQKQIDILSNLYSAIQMATNAKYIVDSTKSPLYGLLLCNVPSIDVYVIQLVRNSNAVAYSWKRKRIRPEVTDKIEYMPQYSSSISAFRWMRSNLYSFLLKKVAYKYMILKYEDYVHKPGQSLSRIASFIETDIDQKSLLDGSFLNLSKEAHSISGNPMRFQNGKILLRKDNDWEKKMTSKDKLIVSLITFPFLKFFRYL